MAKGKNAYTAPVEETPEEVIEAPESLVETSEPVERAKTHIVKDGDTYASLAARFNPGGMSNYAYAQYLMVLNGGKINVIGAEVKL